MRLLISLVCLVATSAAVGSGLTASLTFNPAPHKHVSDFLFAAPQQDASTAVAVHAQELSQIEKHLEAIDRDREDLRKDQRLQAEAETHNYNEVIDRMNVADAKLSQIYGIGGVLVTLSSIVQAFFVISEAVKRRRMAHERESTS